MSTVLVVGSTGILGTVVCKQLIDKGHEVRALVRSGSDPDKKNALKEMGASLVEADLKEPATLLTACKGAQTVINTASSTLSRREGDTIDSVDRVGNLALVQAAEEADVEHFIFVSFDHTGREFPLDAAKQAVEQRLEKSSMNTTVLQPTNFMEVWFVGIPHMVGFDLAAGSVKILGSGEGKLSWIALGDVASFTTGMVDNKKAYNQVFSIGGPDDLSMLEVVQIFEAATGKELTKEHIPREGLEAGLAAPEALQQSFAALMLNTADGGVLDSSAALDAVGLERTSVKDFVAALLAG